MPSFIAAGTAYSTYGISMIPFYIYYSMFGFQRVGDSSGPPATLVPALSVPNLRAYDPAVLLKVVLFAYSRGITSSR